MLEFKIYGWNQKDKNCWDENVGPVWIIYKRVLDVAGKCVNGKVVTGSINTF